MTIKLEDIKIEILKKIENIDKCKSIFYDNDMDRIEDCLDLINNDVEKMHDLCKYYYCKNIENKESENNTENNSQNNIFNISYEYILYFTGLTKTNTLCDCKYHSVIANVLDEMLVSINKIKKEHNDNYLMLYHYSDKLKMTLF